MAANSKIEWTECTWNPVTGCTKVSPGCRNCYAERMARRLQAMGQPNYRNGFTLTTHAHMLELPLRWRQPRSIFVNSMSDLFHKDVPHDWVIDIRDQCIAAQVPFFFKQWGGINKKAAGPQLENRTWDQTAQTTMPREHTAA